jgi:hypothetical protein
MIIGKIQPPVQRRHAFMKQVLEQRELQQIDVKMDDVEFVSAAAYPFQHHKHTGRMIADASQAQALRTKGNQFRGCSGVAARKKRDVVTFSHEFFGKPGNYSFSTSIKTWRNGFGQRCYLRNPHHCLPLEKAPVRQTLHDAFGSPAASIFLQEILAG